VEFPSAPDLVEIIDRTTVASLPHAQAVATSAHVQEMQQLARAVEVASHVKGYVARLIQATHPTGRGAAAFATRYVRYGSSPRGAQALILAAKVRALISGRANVAFTDLAALALPALRHRVILNFEGEAEGIEPDAIIRHVLEQTPELEGATM
jgi:MoxR-like ATPase